MLSTVLKIIVALAVAAEAVSPTVSLGYSTYHGATLNNGVSQWLGMRYAAPPLGPLRFAAPADPVNTSEVQGANKHGLICLATNAHPMTNDTSEDCLFIDVYAPSAATTVSKLPVFFFIQGGGFNSNSNSNYNGSGLIKASDDDIVVVNFNYRVGPWGFLAGQEILQGGSVNNGMKDIIKALEWVQKYIVQFGGDPAHVTVGGDSAGAGAVTLLLTAYGGRDDGLFHATAAESQSFPTVNNVADSQYQYDNLVIRTQCTDATDTLSCLRNLSAPAIQAVNFNTPSPRAQDPPLYMYGPVIDYDLIPDYTYRLFQQGRFVHVPTIFGDDTNGGTVFTPRNTSTLAASNVFLKDQFPYLTLAQLREINARYPVEGRPQFNGTGRYWRQISDVYGDIRYTCPGLYCSSAFTKYGMPDVWNYLYNVSDPIEQASGLGVPHTIEVHSIWGPENTNGGAPASYYPGKLNDDIVPVMQGYWTSFIRTFDPNVHRVAGSPEWTRWTAQGQQRIVLQTNASYVAPIDAVKRDHCAYFNSIGVALHQ